jgi:hypothetical protein
MVAILVGFFLSETLDTRYILDARKANIANYLTGEACRQQQDCSR